MEIGEMKQRIEFMVEENVSDGQGGYDTTLVSKGSTWAKVTNIHGGEYFFAAAVHLEKDVSFVIRYRSDISEKWNIKFRGQKYNIQFIDNDVEDALIDSLIQSSTTTVENVLRHPLSDYTTLPKKIKKYIKYVVE